MLQWLIGPAPPTGHSSIGLTEVTYTSTLMAKASLMGASLLPMVGKMKLTGILGCHPNIR